MFREEGMPSFTQPKSVVVTVTIQKRWMNPVHHWVGVVVTGEKCNAVVVMVVVRGEDGEHKVPLKNKYVAISIVKFLIFCVTLFQVNCCSPKICENGEKHWEWKRDRTKDTSQPENVKYWRCMNFFILCFSPLTKLKGKWTKDTSWPKNIEDVGTFSSACFILLFCQYVYNRSTFCLEFELPRVQPCWFCLYQWRAEKSWCMTCWCFTLLPQNDCLES